MNEKDYITIKDSNEFDYDYYIENYDIEYEDPIIHYLNVGTKKGYNPSPKFNTNFYLESNPDVKRSGMNPFIHYLLYGKSENRLGNKISLNDLKDDKNYLKGFKNYHFKKNDKNGELLQYYDYTYKNKFNYMNFNSDYIKKIKFFDNNGIKYDFLIIPDKSIVCNDVLPFYTSFVKRNIDLTKLIDFSRYLTKEEYHKLDSRLNYDGGLVYFKEIIKIINNGFDLEKIDDLISVNKLEKKNWKNDIITSQKHPEDNVKESCHDEYVYEIPINLVISKYNELTDNYEHYYNKDSYSENKAIIVHDDGIEAVKGYLSFYFREIIFCNDENEFCLDGIINEFNPDFIFELRKESILENYEDNAFNKNYGGMLENTSKRRYDLYHPLVNKNITNIPVSVIIPVYNTSNYLRQCIDSVINQSLDDFEIICINDGSTDNSLDILKDYVKENDNIHVLSVKNNGQGAARNKALKITIGKYVYFLDSDDWIKEDTLKQLYERANGDNLELLFYQSINYIEDENRYYETDLDNFKALDDHFGEELSFNHEDTKDFIFEIPVNPVAKLYKKEFLDKYNIQFPEGIYFEDNAFFYRVYFNCKKAGFLRGKFYNRRIRSGSITRVVNETSFDCIEANNKIIETFEKYGQYENYKKQLVNHCFDNIYYFFNRFALNLKYKFYEIMRENFIGFTRLKEDFIENLNEDKLLIYNIILKNKYYIDYLSEYKLKTAEYFIYDGEDYYYKNSQEYDKKKANDKKYKISIIIPIYNNEKVIHRTLMSIINQSMDIDDIEVLMINDCSKDNTQMVLDKYAKMYESFKSIHITSSTGAAGTPRNIGIYESNADYIMFLDHDDFFELDALETLYKLMMSNDVDIVYGVWAEIIKGKRYDRYYNELKEGYFKNLNQYEKLIAHPAPSIWTKLFKKKLIVDNEILFPTILGEDAIFISKALIKADGILFLKNKIMCYHDLSDESTTNNVSYKYLSEGFVSEIYMFDYYRDIGKEHYYKFRTDGIIDFFISQYYISNLSYTESKDLFCLFHDFCKIIDYYDKKPKLIKNRFIYDLILGNDFEAMLEFKKLASTINDETPVFLKDQINRNIKDNKEIEGLKKENNYLNTFRNNVLNSRSWKFTEIFRRMNSKIKNL